MNISDKNTSSIKEPNKIWNNAQVFEILDYIGYLFKDPESNVDTIKSLFQRFIKNTTFPSNMSSSAENHLKDIKDLTTPLVSDNLLIFTRLWLKVKENRIVIEINDDLVKQWINYISTSDDILLVYLTDDTKYLNETNKSKLNVKKLIKFHCNQVFEHLLVSEHDTFNNSIIKYTFHYQNNKILLLLLLHGYNIEYIDFRYFQLLSHYKISNNIKISLIFISYVEYYLKLFLFIPYNLFNPNHIDTKLDNNFYLILKQFQLTYPIDQSIFTSRISFNNIYKLFSYDNLIENLNKNVELHVLNEDLNSPNENRILKNLNNLQIVTSNLYEFIVSTNNNPYTLEVLDDNIIQHIKQKRASCKRLSILRSIDKDLINESVSFETNISINSELYFESIKSSLDKIFLLYQVDVESFDKLSLNPSLVTILINSFTETNLISTLYQHSSEYYHIPFLLHDKQMIIGILYYVIINNISKTQQIIDFIIELFEHL